MFMKYIFHKNQKCAPQMRVNIYKGKWKFWILGIKSIYRIEKY